MVDPRREVSGPGSGSVTISSGFPAVPIRIFRFGIFLFFLQFLGIFENSLTNGT